MFHAPIPSALRPWRLRLLACLGIGLEHVDHFSSVEGIPVYQDHEYEMVSVYDNTTDEPSDAMATMFVYMLDQETEESIHRVRQRLVWAREAYASSSAATQ